MTPRESVDHALDRMSTSDLHRVLRLCWAIQERGSWSERDIAELARQYPAPVAMGAWRKECAAALDRLVASGIDDPVEWLASRIRRYAAACDSGSSRPQDGKWWLRDGEYSKIEKVRSAEKDAAEAQEILRRNRVEGVHG